MPQEGRQQLDTPQLGRQQVVLQQVVWQQLERQQVSWQRPRPQPWSEQVEPQELTMVLVGGGSGCVFRKVGLEGSQAKEVIREYGLHDAQERMSLDGLLVMRNLDSNKYLVQMNFREWLDSS
ncbi:Inositol Hexakisphosphate And Diphosphoinositol-Pentakisphosphate Kinase 1 [Manis pentadactyla]|nr:Inositol Hexakisphosphate And Diphosphoinositol-Pentakisphosphate Kinase 1 [Manis pentadactyla]